MGITGREEFYDATGAARDIFQNHLLQMIAVTLMEEPASLSANDIRRSRSQLLRQITFSNQTGVNQNVVFGQYAGGVVEGQVVPGYTQEKSISNDSKTETAVAVKLTVNNDRWRDMPIYVRTGKRLAAEVLEISIQFKDPKNTMFNGVPFGPDPNILTFRFQPNEAIVLRLFVKKPGHGIELDMVPMEFNYHNQYRMNLIEAYERLIHDASMSDPTLFPDAESIETSWKIVDQILSYKPEIGLVQYEAGSWGPTEFTSLIQRDGRKWLEPTLYCERPQG
jgi:glucose-6-phosphate 1-dehydrogenase